MKKSTALFLFIILLGLTQSFAQSALRKGEKQLNAGFGFSDFGLPIYVGVDFAVHEDITVGPQISFRSRFGVDLIVISGNANYHFNTLLEIPREFDVYAGLTLGYYNYSTAFRDSRLNLTAQIGGRYYFDPKWAFNLEFGGGKVTGGKIGISYKF